MFIVLGGVLVTFGRFLFLSLQNILILSHIFVGTINNRIPVRRKETTIVIPTGNPSVERDESQVH